jgi:hypothetical protein
MFRDLGFTLSSTQGEKLSLKIYFTRAPRTSRAREQKPRATSTRGFLRAPASEKVSPTLLDHLTSQTLMVRIADVASASLA